MFKHYFVTMIGVKCSKNKDGIVLHLVYESKVFLKSRTWLIVRKQHNPSDLTQRGTQIPDTIYMIKRGLFRALILSAGLRTIRIIFSQHVLFC